MVRTSRRPGGRLFACLGVLIGAGSLILFTPYLGAGRSPQNASAGLGTDRPAGPAPQPTAAAPTGGITAASSLTGDAKRTAAPKARVIRLKPRTVAEASGLRMTSVAAIREHASYRPMRARLHESLISDLRDMDRFSQQYEQLMSQEQPFTKPMAKQAARALLMVLKSAANCAAKQHLMDALDSDGSVPIEILPYTKANYWKHCAGNLYVANKDGVVSSRLVPIADPKSYIWVARISPEWAPQAFEAHEEVLRVTKLFPSVDGMNRYAYFRPDPQSDRRSR